MKISEIDELFEKCWKGYEKKGMKTMFGKRVPNCVKKESVELSEGQTVAVKFYDEFDSGYTVHIGDNTLSLNGGEVNKNLQWDRPKGHAFSDAEIYVSKWMYKTAKNWNEVHAWLKRVRDTGDEKALLAAVQKAFKTGSMAPKIVEGQELDEDFSSVSKMQHATTIGELIDAIEPIADELASDMAEIVRAKGVSDNTTRKAYHILNRFIHWGKSSEEPISIKAIKRIPNIGKVSASILADFLETELGIDVVNEDLRAWFGKGKKGGAGGGGWDRYNTKGERVGKCGDSKPGEGKPKCLSKSRAASLRSSGGKKAIANAVKRKKANDPNQNRRGKAKNVNNHPKK